MINIPPNLFDKDKPFISIDKKHNNKSKCFIEKCHHFPNGKCRISIKRITKKVKSLFQLQEKSIYPGCKIFHGCALVKKTKLMNQNVLKIRNTITIGQTLQMLLIIQEEEKTSKQYT